MIMPRHLSAYVNESRAQFEDFLAQMVEIPSISMDPSRAKDMGRMADLAEQVLTQAGAQAEIVETGGYPIVSAGWTTGGEHPHRNGVQSFGRATCSRAGMAATTVCLSQ